MQVQIRQDEQLVPEDVPAVRLAVQSPGGYAHVQLGRVRGESLEQVEQVQAQDAAGLTGDVQVGPPPQPVPGRGVRGEQFRVIGRPCHIVDGGQRRITDRRVTGGVQGHDLFDHARLPVREGDPQPVGGAEGAQDGPALHGPARRDTGARRAGDADVGGGGAAAQPQRRRVHGSGVHPGQMPSGERAVAFDARVADVAVERALHLQLTRPAVRRELRTQHRQMWVGHVHETALHHEQAPRGRQVDTHAPGEDAGPQVERLPVLQQARVVRGEPPGGRPALRRDAEAQRQPVGQVDQVLVLHLPPGHLRQQSVVAAGAVRTGVVVFTRGHLRGRSPRGEIPVTERAQGFPQAFLRGVIALVLPGPLPRRRDRSGRRPQGCGRHGRYALSVHGHPASSSRSGRPTAAHSRAATCSVKSRSRFA